MRRASKCCGFFISMFFFPHNLTQMMDRFDTIDESTQLEGKLSIVASGRIWLCIIACGDWCSSNNDSRHIGTFLINRRRMRLPLTISFPCNVIRCEPQSFGLIRNGRILCYFGWMLDLLSSHTNSSQCLTVLCRIIVPVHIISTNEVINTSFTSLDRTTRFDVIIIRHQPSTLLRLPTILFQFGPYVFPVTGGMYIRWWYFRYSICKLHRLLVGSWSTRWGQCRKR